MTAAVCVPASPGAGGVVRAGRPSAVGRRVGRLRAEVLFLGCGVLLLPWAALLAALPGGRPWAVLDLGEAAALCTAAARLRRGLSPFWPAVLAGLLLLTDAGCDVASASGGGELLTALLMAACAELPLAAKCWSTAFRRGVAPAPAAGRRPARSLRKRATTSTPVGERPAGFLTEGVPVRNAHLTARSAPGTAPGCPSSRVHTRMSDRLRAAGAGPPGLARTGCAGHLEQTVPSLAERSCPALR
ncbi:hypothetical protein [Kitasatospora sp. NPDC057198]|uniref:hypothetical protein n=1 Tax=Kitasatospora sp. NPDC057198 TaxID=3346046 RepID=UPI00363E9101